MFHVKSTGKTKGIATEARKYILKDKCIQNWEKSSIIGRTCNSGSHVSFTATAQEHLSTSGVLSLEILRAAKDASSDVLLKKWITI